MPFQSLLRSIQSNRNMRLSLCLFLSKRLLKINYKAMQSDWGGEYWPFQSFLKDNGIVHKVTCLYAHQENGTFKWKHRHIVETGLTLIAHVSFPLQFWKHAFVYVVYLINQLPSSNSPLSPLEILLKRKPNYSHLKVLGCICYPLLRPFNKSKL